MTTPCSGVTCIASLVSLIAATCTALQTLLHYYTSLPRRVPPFHWDAQYQQAFDSPKAALTQTPILAFPQFMSSVPPFSVQTDASAVGVGGVLKQDRHIIVYASRSLTPSTLSIARANITAMPMHCPGKLTAHTLSQLPVSHYQLHWKTSCKVRRTMPPVQKIIVTSKLVDRHLPNPTSPLSANRPPPAFRQANLNVEK